MSKSTRRYASGDLPGRGGMGRGRRVMAGAMSAVLGISMSIPFGAVRAMADEANGQTTDPDSTEQKGTSQTAKKEIVYAKTDAAGEKSGVYVVNYWDTDTAQDVSDPGTYTKLQNLTTSQKLDDDGGKVDVTTLAGKPFYYQGDLDASTQLPWNVSVTYRLDGKEVSPSDLAGKDGDLDIELKIDGLSDDTSTADFAKSFMVQAQGTFDNGTFSLSDAKDATIATVGNKTVVTYLLLPGSNGDWHIKGKASDFTYSGWQIAAMPISLDTNVSDYDTSKLTDATSKLQSGVDQLDQGGKSLAAGLYQLNVGADSAVAGAAKLGAGATQLASGSDRLASGAGQADAGTAELAAGASQLADGVSRLQREGTSAVSSGASQLADGTSQAVAGTEQAAAGGRQVADGASQLSSGVSALQSQGTSQVASGALRAPVRPCRKVGRPRTAQVGFGPGRRRREPAADTTRQHASQHAHAGQHAARLPAGADRPDPGRGGRHQLVRPAAHAARPEDRVGRPEGGERLLRPCSRSSVGPGESLLLGRWQRGDGGAAGCGRRSVRRLRRPEGAVRGIECPVRLE